MEPRPLNVIAANIMSTETKPTVFERIAALKEWIQPQRRASYKQKASEADANFAAASALMYMLEQAGRSLSELPNNIAANPLNALDNLNSFEYACQVELLLFRYERWMRGECTAEELVTNTYEYCKNRVLDGHLAQLNCTSQLVNLISVNNYRVYCEAMRTINREILSLNEERKKETAEASK